MYKAGQRFLLTRRNGDGDLIESDYILAQVAACKFALIDLNDGNRWYDPVEVEDSTNVSHEEMEVMRGCMPEGYVWKLKEN